MTMINRLWIVLLVLLLGTGPALAQMEL